MADNATDGPANDAEPPNRPPSPATRKQDSRRTPPSPPTRVQPQAATPPSPPTRVQPQAATPPSPPTRKQTPDPTPDAAPPSPPSPPTRVQRQNSVSQGDPVPLPRQDSPPASPPTRAQRPGAKKAAAAGPPPSPPTRHQDAQAPTPSGGSRHSDPPTRRESGNRARAEFPQGLLDRYEPYNIAGAGSEGTVWHVRRLADGSNAAVKIAHPGQSMDMDTLEHLATPEFSRHTPRIHEFGDVAVGPSVCGWVAMEYLPETFEDLLSRRLRDGKPRQDRKQTERTVRELADLLDFWQTRIDRNPLDLKPANILVRRSAGPHEFVVADFGGIARFTVSQSYRDFQITALYMAPEQIVHQNLKATPWWTLGLILYQVFTGRPLYVLGDDALITDEAWTRGLILNNEVDLSAVTDVRQNLLLQGLLTKDPDDRWTAPEVRRWLKGEDPPVVRPPGPVDQPSAAARHAHRPISFRGVAHHEAENLAAEMARHSQEAADWLQGDGGPRLAAWLRDDLQDTSYDDSQLLALRSGRDRPVRAALAALSFVAVFAPTATPQYRGRRVDAEGIARIAQGQGSVAFVDELLGANVPAVASRFRCYHSGCDEGACAVLLALAAELADTVEAVRGRARSLRRRGSADGELDQRETDATYGVAAALIVHPEQRRQVLLPLTGLPGLPASLVAKAPAAVVVLLALLRALLHQAGAVLGRRSPDAAFLRRWAALHRGAAHGDVRTVRGRAALVAAAVLLPRALRADAIGQDHEITLGERWSASWRPLVRRLAAGAVLFAAFWLLIWSGALVRAVLDTGGGWALLSPGEGNVVPLARAADAAARAQADLCAVALAGAVAFAAAPARASARMFVAAAALVAWVGYARPDLPPLTPLHAPDWVVERLRDLLGGWQSWNGLAAFALVVPAGLLLALAARQLQTARVAETEQAGLRRERAEQRRARMGLPRRPYQNPERWRTGRPGLLDRLLFAVAALLALVTLLWAVVEIRVAHTGEHPTLASWGTGQQGAAYQSQYILACAAVCVVAALFSPQGARRMLRSTAVVVMVLGFWPPPVQPARSVSFPVTPELFAEFAATWGHGAFWAALLLALPLSLYAGGFAAHRSRRAAR
ncbi:protein kinase domain-containing protein [Streptomyces microflavus]|uniref:protein kinase domain-containing protein n=1 Tax=Streptomyces microflavus TaxID=1919 RepID=UPI003403678A